MFSADEKVRGSGWERAFVAGGETEDDVLLATSAVDGECSGAPEFKLEPGANFKIATSSTLRT